MDIKISEDQEIKVVSFLKYSTRAKCKSNTFGHIGPFLVDEVQAKVTCEACLSDLNPFYVLQQMAQHETRWHDFKSKYLEQRKELSEKTITKCQHCKKMTRIKTKVQLV